MFCFYVTVKAFSQIQCMDCPMCKSVLEWGRKKTCNPHSTTTRSHPKPNQTKGTEPFSEVLGFPCMQPVRVTLFPASLF